MDDRPSYSVAPGDRARSRVLSLPALLALVLLSLLGLVLVFPKDDLFRQLRADSEKTDPALTIAYLRNIIRIESRDMDLRLLLADKLAEQREFEQAAHTLREAESYIQNAPQRRNWEEAQALLVWRQYQITRVDRPDAERAAFDAQMRPLLMAQIPRLHQVSRLLFLAEQTARLQDRILLQALFGRVQALPGTSMTDLTQAARIALGQGLFEHSARLYFLARSKVGDSAARNEMVMRGVKSLLAGGQPVQAFEEARRQLDHLGPADPLLWDLVRLGLGAGRPHELVDDLRRLLPDGAGPQELAARFSAEQLDLAQTVLLGAGQPQQALRVAHALAVLQPDKPGQRELLARLSEWAGQPAQALALWRELLQSGYADKAIEQLMRLGPMLHDDDTLLMAWHARARQRSLSLEELTQLVQVYERLGQPGKALQWLDEGGSRAVPGRGAQTATGQAARVAGLRAALLERMGRWDEALQTLDRARSAGWPLQRDDALRAARLHVRRGQMEPALQSLLDWSGAVSPPARDRAAFLGRAAEDLIMLDLMGDLAWETGQRDLAYRSYRQMWQLDRQRPELAIRDYQIERLLRHLLDAVDKAGARDLAADLYRRVRSDTVVYLWMDSLHEGGESMPADAADARERQRRALQQMQERLAQWKRQLDPAHLRELEKSAEFLARRAVLHVEVRDMKAAIADYQASLARTREPDVETSYWWLLIDQGEHRLLRTEVSRRLVDVRRIPAYQEVLGASFQVFHEPRLAWEFYQRQARDRSQDYLWLANYADVLDQVGKSMLAQRVRQHAFGLLNRELRRLDPARREEAMQALLVRLRLSEAYASGPEKERLVRLLGMARREGRMTAQHAHLFDDLVVSWALAADRHELARQWLLQQRLQSVVRETASQQAREAVPATQGEMSHALATRDKAALADLLLQADAEQFRMHPYDRLQALRILGRLEQATDLAVHLAHRAGEDGLAESEQEALEADLLKRASRASVTTIRRTVGGVLAQRGVDLQADLALREGWRVQARETRLSQHTLDTTVLGAVPSRDQTRMVGISHERDQTRWQAQLTQKSGLASISGLLLRMSHVIDPRHSVVVDLAFRQGLDESAALAAGGVHDRLSLQWTHKVSKELSLDARWAAKRYYTQHRVALGQGQDLSAFASWQLHGQRPQWVLRASLRRSLQSPGVQADPQVSLLHPAALAPDGRFFLSSSTTAWNVSLGYNIPEALDAPDAYSRALRPWAEIGFEQSRGAGQRSGSPSVRAGVRTSVLGRDQLVVGMEIKPQRTGASSRSAQVQYEWIGDR